MTAEDRTEYQSAIGQAIHLLQHGRALPFHLHTELREQGYDVLGLISAHFKPTKGNSTTEEVSNED